MNEDFRATDGTRIKHGKGNMSYSFGKRGERGEASSGNPCLIRVPSVAQDLWLRLCRSGSSVVKKRIWLLAPSPSGLIALRFLPGPMECGLTNPARAGRQQRQFAPHPPWSPWLFGFAIY